MGEFSLPHILLVLVIVLVFFGPSRLPGLGKSLGEAIRGFKQGITPDDNAAGSANQQTHQQTHQGPTPQNLQAPHVNQALNSSADSSSVHQSAQSETDAKNPSRRS